jgi:peptidoglycan/LPS O-acetylase OafA/YrhL
MNSGRWDSFLFVCGMILAELRIIRQASTFCLEDFCQYLDERYMKYGRVGIRCFWVFVFIVGLYLGSWPSTSHQTYGYITFTSWTPRLYHDDDLLRSFFWECIGAVMMLTALENYKSLQLPFNSALARYMGDMSFSLYICHWPILLTFTRHITPAIMRATGSDVFGFCMGGIITIPVLVWVSDIQRRAFDETSVTFARKLARRCAA